MRAYLLGIALAGISVAPEAYAQSTLSAASGDEPAVRRAMYAELEAGAQYPNGWSASGAFLWRSSRHWAYGLSGGMVSGRWTPDNYDEGWVRGGWMGVFGRVYGIDRALADPYFHFGLVGVHTWSKPEVQCPAAAVQFGPQLGIGMDWYIADWVGVGVFGDLSLPILPLPLCSGDDSSASDELPSQTVIAAPFRAGGSLIFGLGQTLAN